VPHLRKAATTVASASALSILALGLTLVASPSAGASGTTNSTTRHHTAKLCSATPKPGFAACMAVKQTDLKPQLADTPAGYGPADITSAYNLPAGGSGQTVGSSTARPTLPRARA
jgi:hypothetical protein